MPALNEERRVEITKIAKKLAEDAKVAVRNARADSHKDIKKALDEKEISEDEERGAEEVVQKLTDDVIKQVEQVLADKEADLMEV